MLSWRLYPSVPALDVSSTDGRFSRVHSFSRVQKTSFRFLWVGLPRHTSIKIPPAAQECWGGSRGGPSWGDRTPQPPIWPPESPGPWGVKIKTSAPRKRSPEWLKPTLKSVHLKWFYHRFILEIINHYIQLLLCATKQLSARDSTRCIYPATSVHFCTYYISTYSYCCALPNSCLPVRLLVTYPSASVHYKW